jgi:hypothetical protein
MARLDRAIHAFTRFLPPLKKKIRGCPDKPGHDVSE